MPKHIFWILEILLILHSPITRACLPNQYSSDDGVTCSNCHASCATCHKAGMNGCLTCDPPKTLSNLGSCIMCHETCATCVGTLQNQCTSCTSPRVYNQGQCDLCHETCETCTAESDTSCLSCPPGRTYSAGKCIVCDPTCLTCLGPESNKCTSCSPDRFLTSDFQCVLCDGTCATCNGIGSNKCLTCPNPSTQYVRSSGTCDTCPSAPCPCSIGEYYDPGSNTCQACHSSCLTCKGSGPSNCLSCIPPKQISETNTCIECHSSCATCVGSGVGQCTSCTPPLVLSTSFRCVACHSSCETCYGANLNHCLSCPTGYYLNFDRTCVQCPSSCTSCVGPNSVQCLNWDCDPSCETCSGPDADQCLSCEPGKVLSSGTCTCHETCATCTDASPTGCTSCFNPTDTLYQGQCFTCDPSCATCSGSGPHECLSCNAPNVLQEIGTCWQCDGNCLTCTTSGGAVCVTCLPGFYLTGFNTCAECASSCETCNGASDSECTSCTAPKILENGSCIQPCDSSCLTCSGNTALDCLSCDSSRYLSSGQCLECDSSCATCNGPGPNSCTSCPQSIQPSSGSCSGCPPNPTIDFNLQAKSFVYLCETVDVQIIDVTSVGYSVTWTVTSSSGNSTNENLIIGMLTASLSISPMTLLYNTKYKLKANVSNDCAFKVKEITIETVKYPITSITSPTSTSFLSWWENEGTLLGCATCSASSADAVPTCQTCSAPLQKDIQGSCLCQNQNSYIDLTNFPQVSCQSKSNSLGSWSLKQKSPNIQMQTTFSNDFVFNEPHLKYIAATMGVNALNDSISIKDYSAISNNPNIMLSFTIPQDIGAGMTIGLTNLSEYNKLPHSPFLIQNPDLTYQLPAIIYLSPETIKILTNTGTATTTAMKAQAIASAVIPAITGGMSTSAMLLIGFLAEVDVYKYINVPFPENFDLFCEQIASNLLPNLFSDFDDNYGANPNSTIGKFEYWGVSATLLDNSSAAIFKDLVVLGIIVAVNILILILKKCPDLYSWLRKVRSLFMWNLFLSFYLGDYSELQLNAMIELREHSVSSLYSNVSLAFSIIIVVTYALLKIYIFYIVNRKHKKPILPQSSSKRRLPTEEGTEVKKTSNSKLKRKPSQDQFCEVPQCVAIITEDFVTKNAFTRNFFLIMLIENFLMVLLVFFFQGYGLAQAIVYTIFTIFYVAIFAWQRPYKSKVQLIILLINQCSKVAMGIAAVIFGINERTNSIPQAVISWMGNALILLIVIVIGINLVVGLIITAVGLYEEIKKSINYIRNLLSKKSAKKKLQQSSNAHHRSIMQDRWNSNPSYSRSTKAHQVYDTFNMSSTTRTKLKSVSTSNNSHTTENSFVSSPEKTKNTRKAMPFHAAVLRIGSTPNTNTITLSKETELHNSTDSNTSMDQSRNELIYTKKSKRKHSPHNRIRGLGQPPRFQIGDPPKVPAKLLVKDKRIGLPYEDS